MDGIVTGLDEIGSSSTESSKSTSSILGKDDFLKLLVTQMQYQDPLNPQTDTDFIAQLAQFSSLEQMQNLNATTVNSQALSLVGKEVVVTSTSATGNATTVKGTVDYVTIKNGDAYLSIDGTLYPAEDVVTVMDSYYAIKDYLPSVEETELSFDKSKPLDLEIEIDLGKEGYQATSVAVVVNGNAVDASNMSYENGVLTIKKEALSDLPVGVHAVGLYFDDIAGTSVTDKVTIKVVNGTESESE